MNGFVVICAASVYIMFPLSFTTPVIPESSLLYHKMLKELYTGIYHVHMAGCIKDIIIKLAHVDLVQNII